MYLAGYTLSLGNFAIALILMDSENHSFHYKELLVIFLFAERAPGFLTYSLPDWSGVILSLPCALRHRFPVKREISYLLW